MLYDKTFSLLHVKIYTLSTSLRIFLTHKRQKTKCKKEWQMYDKEKDATRFGSPISGSFWANISFYKTMIY